MAKVAMPSERSQELPPGEVGANRRKYNAGLCARHPGRSCRCAILVGSASLILGPGTG
jgi:hypothetical protein